MKKKRLVCIGVIIIVLLLLVSPPVVIVKGVPVFGKSTEEFKDPMEHYADYDRNFPNNRRYYITDFKHFYFINLKFWQDVEIKQLEYYDQEAGSVKRIIPGVYAVTHEAGESALYSFEVQRGNGKWYFDYEPKPDI